MSEDTTEPNSLPVETLGSLLSARFSESGDESFALPEEALTGELGRPPAAAVVAFTPGWDRASPGLGEATPAARSSFTVIVDKGIIDLSLPALQALNEYAWNVTKANNKYKPSNVVAETVGHRRGQALVSAGDKRHGFLENFAGPIEEGDDATNPDQADNIASSARFKSLAADGFFTPEQRESLLSKDHEKGTFKPADGSEGSEAVAPDGPSTEMIFCGEFLESVNLTRFQLQSRLSCRIKTVSRQTHQQMRAAKKPATHLTCSVQRWVSSEETLKRMR